MNRNEFEQVFQEEHRTILTQTERLVHRLRENDELDLEDVKKLNDLLGPHFRYEEEALYPALKDQYGRIYVKRLYNSHEGTTHTIRKLMSMTEGSSFNRNEALELIHGWLLPHVSDCEGLSIMVEQVSDQALDDIVEARDKALRDGLDLLTWVDEVREKPDLETLTIFN